MSKIIHADNSDFFKKLVRTFLIETGFSAESTDSGEDAFIYAKDGNASAIIMGMTLKDMQGEDLLKKILSLPHSVPVIILTANDDAAEKERLLAMGFSAYISKAGNWQQELQETLQKLL